MTEKICNSSDTSAEWTKVEKIKSSSFGSMDGNNKEGRPACHTVIYDKDDSCLANLQQLRYSEQDKPDNYEASDSAGHWAQGL